MLLINKSHRFVNKMGLAYRSFHQTATETDIVIKPADKGSGTVIMDYKWYVNECLRHAVLTTTNTTKNILKISLMSRIADN